MEEEPLSPFGGMSGRVLREAMTPYSLASGVLLGMALGAGMLAFGHAGKSGLAMLWAEVVVALALARFALNGRAGEWTGTLLSSRGGEFFQVVTVAGRYLALSFLWMLPLVLLGLRPEAIVPAPSPENPFGFPGFDGKALVLLLLYLFGSAVTPALFLVAAVSAEKLAELAQPESWRRWFSGRGSDLMTMYALQFGGVLLAVFLSIPALIIAFTMGAKMGVFTAGVLAAFLLGLGVNLLGRLCGCFAAGLPEVAPREARAPRPTPASPAARLARPAIPPAAVPPSAAPAAATASATVAIPIPAALATPVASATVAMPAAGRAILLDPRERVEAAFARFVADPAGAIDEMMEVHASYLPNPLVMHALVCMLARAARTAESAAMAPRALALCFQRGHVQLAADILVELRPQAPSLGLTREQVIQIGRALGERGDHRNAANIFAMVLQADPGDVRAVKGMLQAADGLRAEERGAEDALKLYRYLLKQCPASPLLDHMRRGEAAAEKLLAVRA